MHRGLPIWCLRVDRWQWRSREPSCPGFLRLPFLVLAASRAARLSPELDRYLRRYSWCDALLNRADSSEGLLSLDRRSVVKMLLLTAAAGAAFALVHPPLPVVIGLEIGVMMAICIKEAGRRGIRKASRWLRPRERSRHQRRGPALGRQCLVPVPVHAGTRPRQSAHDALPRLQTRLHTPITASAARTYARAQQKKPLGPISLSLLDFRWAPD